jgi:hypothetical protein
MSRIVAGFLIAATGAAIVIYTETILSNFGAMEWAERWIPFYGGSRLAYKVIGILAIAIGFMMVTGLLGPVILALFGGLFSGLGPVTPR